MQIKRVQRIISSAALTVVAGMSVSSAMAANTLTWTGTVADPSSSTYTTNVPTTGVTAPGVPLYTNGANIYLWNTSASSANWSGPSSTYSVGDNVVFTDNFTGGNIIRLSSGNLNPASMTFSHISGSVPTTYVFVRTEDIQNSSAANLSSNTPFGAGASTVLTLDTGFLGTVILRARSNGTAANGNTIVRSGTLEVNDGLAIIGGANQNGTNLTLAGGTFAVNVNTPTSSTNTGPASTNMNGTLTVSGTGTIALKRDDGAGAVTSSRTWQGPVSMDAASSLNLISLTGVRMALPGNLSAAAGTFNLYDGASTATVVTVSNNLGAPNATFNLGSGTSVLEADFGTATTYQIGAIVGGGSTTLRGARTAAGTVTFAIGGKSINNQYDGLIADGTAVLAAVQKVGTGTLNLTGPSTFTGTLSSSNGTLVFSGANGSALGTNTVVVNSTGTLKLDNTTSSNSRLADTAVLTLNRGNFEFAGNLSGTAEVVDKLVIAGGSNNFKLAAVGSGSSASINFANAGGGFSRTGGVVNFDLASGVTANFTNAPALTGGILGGYATANTNDWATVSGGAIAAYSAYTAAGNGADSSTWAATDNLNVSATSSIPVAASKTVNSVKFTGAGADISIASGQGLTIATGGILATSSTASISGAGSLTAGSGSAAELFAVVPNAAGTLTINSPIANNGSGIVSLTKAGPGTLVLGGANTFTGALSILSGSVKAGAANVFPATANLTVDFGTTFDLAGFNQNFGTVNLIDGSILSTGGAATITAGTYTVSNGVVAAKLAGTAALTKSGSGSVTLNAVNTYSGLTTISAGTLVAGAAGAIPANGNLTMTGGALDIGANSQTLGAATLTNGLITGTSGTITAASYWVDQGTVTVNLGGSGVGLTKGNTVNQTVALNGNNTFNGPVNIGLGVLQVAVLANGGQPSGLGASSNDAANLVFNFNGGNNGALTYSGTGANTDRLFTLGGSTVALNSSGTGSLNFTNTGALVGSTGTFIFGGSFTGNNSFAPVISGSTIVQKSNAGVWALTATNTYTGATILSGGTLSVATIGNGGVNSNMGAAANVASNILFSGGNLRYTGSGSTTDRLFTIGTSTGTLDASGSGALVFGNTAAHTIVSGASRTFTIRGTNTGNNTIAGILADAGAGSLLSVTKLDAGKWVLSGANTYTGTTTVSGGTLQLGKSAQTPVLSGTTTTGAVVDTALVLDYSGGGTNPSTSVQTILKASYASSTNFTSGVIRSTTSSGIRALGWADNGSAVTIISTFDGDANLDGKVNTIDFNVLAGNFGSTGKVWSEGNFNYDATGLVDSLDFNLLVGAYGSVQAQPGGSAPLAGASLGAVVPEPASLSLLALGAAGLMRRRR